MINSKPYKVEVWEDKWVAATNDSPELIKERGGYWEEVRSVCLASNTNQDFLGRAFNIILTRDVTGEITLSFDIYGYYYENGIKTRNLLVPYLFNEVKIKVFYDNQWYDFIIKEMNEAHDNKGLIYEVSCIYLPMAELSKNGWEIGFSLDQENCIGTIDYFTNIILDGTDWTYQPNDNCNLTEYSLEYLYVAKIARNMYINSIEDYYNPTSVRQLFRKDAYVYVPYSQINNTDNIQFIYSDNYSFEENSYTITKGTMNFSTAANNLVFNTDNEGNRAPEMSSYYGYRIAQTQEQIWEPEISRYSRVYTYTKEDGTTDKCYGYDDTKITIDVNLVPTIETVTKYYKKVTDASGKENIYKLKILYGFGLPTEQSSTVIGTPQYLQKYVDTSTTNFQAYVYLNSWQPLNSEEYNGSEMKLGEEEIVYFNEFSTSDLPNLTPVYLEKNEKQRSLVEEKSNRFNLIQKLAELFEVWSEFKILHDDDGRITINPETGLPYKIITFKTELGKDNYAGFSYEINISGIKRTVDSTSLATKMYVEVVDNENAENGICSIQTADNNLGKEIFLINLDYYSQMGMIDRNKLLKDLYGTTSSDLGYLTNLGRLNTLYTENTEKRDGVDGLAIQISTSQEKVLFYNDAVTAAEKELEDLLEKEQNGLTYSESLNIDELKANAQQTLQDAKNDLANEKARLEGLQAQLDAISQTLAEIEEEKEKLNATFYNIYSRFLSEGTWQGTDYIDPNAYYLDASKVLLESSRPIVEYEINVYDVSCAYDFVNNDTYELYRYELGDITYIEDPDYFGYDSTGRPYREKVIVSTIENNLDSPESNKITIQNYKTRFEDLFQRTTATVQSYTLNKNIYDRVEVIEANNSISHDTLQNTLANNSFILSQSKTNSVIIDDAGIEVSNLNDYSQKVRIVAGGIFISNDGGVTWNSGITGAGINTKYLLAGQIDVEKINIMNGSFPTFSWDKYGINAFSWAEDNSTGISYGYYSSFIRYDQYGIYGIRNSQFGTELPFIPNHKYNIAADGTVTDSGDELSTISEAIDNIKQFSQFSLTWNGFNLKTDTGAIEIDSLNDIRVLDNNGNQRVKLGEIGTNLYGLVLSDGNGHTTLQSNSDGNLALTGKIYLGSETNEQSQATVAIGDLGTEQIVQEYLNRNRRILVQRDPTEGGGQPIPTFVVYDTGEIYLEGGITADYGNIGGFVIENDRLYSSDVILSPDGIILYGGKLSIYNNNNEQVLYADSNGNIIGNNLIVNGGNFNNIQVSASGSFDGTITATRGLLNGSLILGAKQPIFVLSSASSYLTDTDLIGVVDMELSNTQDLAVDNNNDLNNYYFVQTNINSQEEILLFKLTQVSVSENSIELVLELIHSDNYSTVTSALIEAISYSKDTFYRVANNNIVLDGRTGNIYTFDYYIQNSGYRLSGDGNITGRDLVLGNNSTITINDQGINININGSNDSIFSVNNDGLLTTNNINITGNSNNHILGNLYVGADSNGIIINGTNGSIYNGSYSSSGGSSGWTINNNGSAVFTDVTVRGRIESSTFIQNEIQALSGTLIIRPTLTFLDNSTITYSDNLYIGYTNEEPGIIDADYYQISHNGAAYNFILRRKTYVSSLDAWEIRLQRVGSSLEIPENIRNEFIELPVINIGNATQNTIGISLNATSNNTTFGFADSITIYDQNITTNNTDEFEFKRNNRLVMGRLPYEESLIPTSMQGSFGLYADNVYLKGAMVSATGTKGASDYMTSGINTAEENGNVFWAGASGDDASAVAAAPFRVTEDGFLYAQKGLFEGEVNAAIIRTAQIIGRDKDSSLRVMTYPDAEGYITFEQYVNSTTSLYDETYDNYKVTAKLSGQEFKIGAPVTIFDNGQVDTSDIPALMSFTNDKTIGLNSMAVYDFYTSGANFFTSNWGIKGDSIYYRVFENNEEAISNIATNYRERALEANAASPERYNIFNLKISEDRDAVDLQLNNQNKLVINDNTVSIYNNMILNDMTGEGIQCSFKISSEFNEDDGRNVVTGYDLFIEES